MAKIYATFSVKGGEWELVDGPDGDYQKHRKNIMEARAKGTKGADELRMIDLKSATTKRAVSRSENRGAVKAERAKYREGLTAKPDSAAGNAKPSQPTKKTAKSKSL